MDKTIKKNDEYSRALAIDGSTTPCDVSSDFEMKLPSYVDHEKIARAQLFFVLNINAQVRAILIGLLKIVPIQTIFLVLEFTRQSSTPRTAYKRYRSTSLHGMIWMKNELKPGTKAWTSLKATRKIHFNISRRTEAKGLGIISQKDMAITQFAFVGSQLLIPHKVGLHGPVSHFEAFSHFWRVMGHLLGIEERFNVCGATLDETMSRLEAIRQDFLLPNFSCLDENAETYMRTVIEGMKGFEPWLNTEAQMFTIKRLVGLSNYSYFSSEISDGNTNDQAYYKLSFYSRFRVTIDVIIFEYLSTFLIFRLCFMIFRMIFSVFDRFPVFAMMKFGRKYAYVEILKSKDQ